MEVNPIDAAVRSYSALNESFRQDDAVERQKRLDEQNQQQRQFENDRQTAADTRAQQTHDAQMQTIQNQKSAAMGGSIKYKSLKGIPLDADELAFVHQQAPQDELLDYYLKNPDKITEGKNALAQIHQDSADMQAGKLTGASLEDAQKRMFENLTKLDPIRLKGLKIIGADFSPAHKGAAIRVSKEVPVLNEDGTPKVEDGKPVMKTVNGVLTKNGLSAEDGPNDPVNFYPVNEVMSNALQRFSTLDNIQNSMDALRVKVGDKEPLTQAINSEKGKKFGEALKKLGEDSGSFSDTQIKIGQMVAEETGDMAGAINTMKALKKDPNAAKPQIHETGTGKPGETQLSAIATDENGKVIAVPIPGTKKVPKPEKDPYAREFLTDKKASRHEIDLGAKDHERAVNAYYKFVKDNPNDYSGEAQALLEEANKSSDAQTARLAAHKANYGEVYTGGGQVVSENVARRQKSGKAQPRTGEPDLATARAYVRKYGDKQKAMEAWQRGE